MVRRVLLVMALAVIVHASSAAAQTLNVNGSYFACTTSDQFGTFNFVAVAVQDVALFRSGVIDAVYTSFLSQDSSLSIGTLALGGIVVARADRVNVIGNLILANSTSFPVDTLGTFEGSFLITTTPLADTCLSQVFEGAPVPPGALIFRFVVEIPGQAPSAVLGIYLPLPLVGF